MRSVCPFSFALFDLDGTLLDSMYVWARVDELFFASRGLQLPEDYGKCLGGMSYRESAIYTVERFHLPDPWEAIVDEWMELARREYAQCVPFKPHALEYLRALRKMGVRLAVVTAMPRNLFLPCLERHGAVDLFESICSTDETGSRGKRTGEVYLLAAQRLGALPGECLVFEDVYEGVIGAKNAGMRVVCVDDPCSTHRHDEIAAMAECIIQDFSQMDQIHPLPTGWMG